MSRVSFKALIGGVAAASFLLSATAAAAGQPKMSQPDPFAVLSVMSGTSSAAALCGAAAAAVDGTTAATQAPVSGCVLPQMDVTPAAAGNGPPAPIPPVSGTVAGTGISPLYLALLAIAGGVGLYLVVHGAGHNHNQVPISAA